MNPLSLLSGAFSAITGRASLYGIAGMSALILTGGVYIEHLRLVNAQATLSAAQAQIAVLQRTQAADEQALAQSAKTSQSRIVTHQRLTDAIKAASAADDGTVAPVLANTLAGIRAAQSTVSTQKGNQ